MKIRCVEVRHFRSTEATLELCFIQRSGIFSHGNDVAVADAGGDVSL